VRTFAALLAFFAIFIIAWLALVPVGVFVVDWMGSTDEAALGLVLFVAPVIAYLPPSSSECSSLLGARSPGEVPIWSIAGAAQGPRLRYKKE
jgi:hypothetical protein